MDTDPSVTLPSAAPPAPLLDDPGAMTPLAFAPNPIQAHLLAAILDARGVETFITGEYSAGLGAYGGGGTVGINVRRADYDRALTELQGFLVDRGDAAPGGNIAPADTCRVCGYDLRGLKNETRCPECGIDQDALARVRNWIRLAPPPNADIGSVGRTVEAVGITMGRIIIALFAAAIIALIIFVAVYALR